MLVFRIRSIYLLLQLLINSVNFSDGSYTWVVEPVDGCTGYEFWYRFGLSWSNTYMSPKSFLIDYVA